ncbi:hypothetical protein TVAG_494900 [Trichomonas vaginalis G3]|uniref:Uncharacterized protein n=1 Tax=Trichomonas vaginalis (strain ATCC PRA-98 / G3) TaxID=412133 RepID=A2EXT7_TRIV3|nr:hypothetical protein TVAGG3_0653930 [Trichomonas vaginalis G3]EAY02541.1 hypothetical protein TVAG_494900 [Trichomonas vaginalis G3]KAI5506033.1 hypothetical protein TVAGG3_0653930 [Trichomonas vaginalis G3]|eukprot:XP_001314780.1 hypothetical protein [Trichomonas vaginalis G3]
MKSKRFQQLRSPRNNSEIDSKSPVPSVISGSSKASKTRSSSRNKQVDTPKTIAEAPNMSQSPITPQNRAQKHNTSHSSQKSTPSLTDKSTQSPPKIYFHTSVECLTSKSRIYSPSKLKSKENQSLYSPSPKSPKQNRKSAALLQSEDSELVSLEEITKPKIKNSSRSSVVRSRKNTEASSYITDNNSQFNTQSIINEPSNITNYSAYTTESEAPMITLKKTYAVVRKSDIGSKDLLEIPDGFFITENDLKREKRSAGNNFSETESHYSLSSQLQSKNYSSQIMELSSIAQVDSQNSLLVNPGASLHERTQSEAGSRQSSIKLLNSSAVATYSTDVLKDNESYSHYTSQQASEGYDFITGESDLAPGQISSILPHFSPTHKDDDEKGELSPEDLGIWLVYPGKSRIIVE